MATEVGKIFVTLELATKAFDRAAERARRTAQGLGSSISRAIDSASGPSMALGGLAASLGGVALKAVSMAGELEQTRMAFTTMLGDAKKADAFIRDMYDFAARTPFEVKGLFESSRMLLAFGFAAEDIKPTLTAIGNAVSALGGSAELIERVTLALGQMRAKGKVSGEEMRQLAEAGVPAWRYLAAAIGTDIPTAMKKAEQGSIKADTAIKAIVEGMNRDFAGMMDKQSRTLLGLWSTAKDTVSQALTSIGEKIIETFDLKGKLSSAISMIQRLADRFRSFLDDLSKLGFDRTLEKWFGAGAREKFTALGGAILGALVPAFAALAASVGSAVAALAPFAAAGALVALIASRFGPKLLEAAGGFEGLRARVQGLVGSMSSIVSRVASAVGSLASAVRPRLAALGSAFSGLVSSARGMAQAIARALAPVARTVAAGLRSIAPYVAPALRNVLAIVTAIVSRVSAVVRAMTPVVAGAFRAIAPVVRAALSAVFAIIRAALALIAGDWKGAWRALVDAVKSIFSPVKGIVESVVSAIKRAVDRLLAPIRSLGSLAARLLGIGGGGARGARATPSRRGGVTPLAAGGIVTRPTLAILGEREREAVVPLSRLPSLLAAAAAPQAVEVVIRPTGGAERFVEAVVRRAARADAVR